MSDQWTPPPKCKTLHTASWHPDDTWVSCDRCCVAYDTREAARADHEDETDEEADYGRSDDE